MSEFARISKFCLLAAVLAFTFSGCKFFGKQEEITEYVPPGELGNGTSVVGSWSTSFSSLSATSEPTTAMTMTYAFAPNGTVRIEAREATGGGQTCVGFGQYRAIGQNNLIVYLQAAQPSNCAFPAQFEMTEVEVSSLALKYRDPASGSEVKLLPDRAQTLAPVGVWKFAGDGGIDYLFFDHHGYFLMQTTISGQMYLVEGFYAISGGELTLSYMDGDPGKVLGTEYFSQYITNGTQLQLDQTSTAGTASYVGTKL